MLKPFVCSLLSLMVFSSAATVLADSIRSGNLYSAALMSLLVIPAAVLAGLYWADTAKAFIGK